jgi:TonB family protein
MRLHTASLVLLFSSLALPAQVPAHANLFAYVGPQYIITAEVGSSHSFILNFINLSDFVIVAQPSEFIYKGASGRFYIGQVFGQEHKDTRGEAQKYTASVLLKGRTFTGLTLLGAFHEMDQIEELSIRIGAKRFYLQPMEKAQFDQLANRVGDLDLKASDMRAALQQADIQMLGTIRNTDGTSEWDRDWQGLIRSDGVNVPKIIQRFPVDPTDEAIRKNTYGRVRLSALINKNGEIQDLRVEKGLGRGLDERATESVKNSWRFLPGTRNGEVIEGAVSFEVEFPPPEKK